MKKFHELTLKQQISARAFVKSELIDQLLTEGIEILSWNNAEVAQIWESAVMLRDRGAGKTAKAYLMQSIPFDRSLSSMLESAIEEGIYTSDGAFIMENV